MPAPPGCGASLKKPLDAVFLLALCLIKLMFAFVQDVELLT